MATNFKGEGDMMEWNGVIATGATLTAGIMVWTTGTAAIVAAITGVEATALAESQNFIGVMANTQTGQSVVSGGHQTGIVVHRRGVFEFVTQAASTGNAVHVGQEVWAAGQETVRGEGSTGLTGFLPVGICVWLNEPDTSAISVRCHVEIRPGKISRVPQQTGTGEL